MEETKERIIKIIRIAIALTLSLLAYFLVNQEHFGQTGYIWNIVLFASAWVILGYDMVYGMIKSIVKEKEFLSENLLMVLASIGAFSLLAFGQNECFEAVLILLFYQIGEMFEDYAKDKTREAVSEASELRSKIAHRKENDVVMDIDPTQIAKGDILCVNVGEILPSDGVVLQGEGRIDASSLTGESVPFRVSTKSEVAAGTILKEGYIEIEATSDYENNTVAKILALIEEGERSKSKVTRFIHRFASIYTPVVFVLAILLATLPPLFMGANVPENWSKWIFHGLCILVIACPCSIIASVPLSYWAGMGLAGRRGILIKGAEVFDRLYQMGIVYTDKTGTLTKGEFKVLNVLGEDKDALLSIAKMCEAHSTHPIARAIQDVPCQNKLISSRYEEIAGQGVIAYVDEDVYLCGNERLLESHHVDVKDSIEAGTAVFIAKNNTYLGAIVLGDETKENASMLVQYLHEHAIQIHLLSGDLTKNAEALGRQLALDGVEGRCSVARKKEAIENACLANAGQVAFMGDGINDASAIAASDLGIAMGGIGSDLAMEHADVVIMNDNPLSLATAHRIAKLVRRQSIFNIVLSLVIKLAIIVCSLVIPGFPLWVAVVADTGLLVLCILLSVSIFLRKRI